MVRIAPAERIAGLRGGDRHALARALSEVEHDPTGPLAAALYPLTGRAHVVGITGPPGSGKSSLASAMTAVYRAAGRTVAVVAVDATSPLTGGAVLGDRIRMARHTGDPGVFIRSMASRGQMGGLAVATSAAVRVLDAAGFQVVLVETVGAGQTEVQIAREAHTTIVVEVPGLGDGVQALKAGMMEVADIFAVNKADLPGADEVTAHLVGMLTFAESKPDASAAERPWITPVLKVSAVTCAGVDQLVAQVDAHGKWLRQTGAWTARERLRVDAELRRLVLARQAQRYDALASQQGGPVAVLLDQLVARTTDPGQAVEELSAHLNMDG